MKIVLPHAIYKQKDRICSLYKSIGEKSFFEQIWNDFLDGLYLRLRVNSAKYIAR